MKLNRIKKYTTCAAFYALVMAGSSLEALPSYNPLISSLFDGQFLEQAILNPDCCTKIEDIECGEDSGNCFYFLAGFYGDYVFDRKMKVNQRDQASGTISTTSLHTNSMMFMVTAFDSFNLFGTVGGCKLGLVTPGVSFGAPSQSLTEIHAQSNLCWSIGGGGTVIEWECVGIGMNLQYFYTKPDLNRVQVIALDQGGSHPYHGYVKAANSLVYHEIQASLGVASYFDICYEFASLIPYFNLKYSNATLDMQDTPLYNGTNLVSTLRTLGLQRHFGYALGATLLINDVIYTTVEGRFYDEKALHVNMQVLF